MTRVVIEIPDEVAKKNHPKAYFDYFGAWSLNLTKTFRKAVFLPSGHGDLIDRDEFLKSFLDSFWSAVKEGDSGFEVVGVVKNIIRNAPIVIEADQENEE